MIRRIASLGLLVLLPGCATIFEGTSQSVAVNTDPPGASCTVTREGTKLGQILGTPGSVHVDKSKNDLTITCAKEGFKTATVSQSSHFVGTTFGNVLIGGLIGVAVDAASGADFTYPKEVSMKLAPTRNAAVPAGGSGPATVIPATATPSSGLPPVSTKPMS